MFVTIVSFLRSARLNYVEVVPDSMEIRGVMSKAILLMNLGSPDSPEVPDVKRYLTEFLMDERVIDIPAWRRTLLVRGLIVPFRAAKSAAAYRTIWTKEGSPLKVITDELSARVEEHTGLTTAVCMRYGNPTPKAALDRLRASSPDLKEVILFPLYPHYAMSSYETGVEYVKEAYQSGKYAFALKPVAPYFDNKDYISALAESIRPCLANSFDKVLFSYHGVPERHIKKSDVTKSHCLINTDCCHQQSPAHAFCYRHQVIKTTELVAAQLGLSSEQWSLSFQSRLGRDPWLKPFTDERLVNFPKEGVKKLVIVCPAFTADCLETLEEIGERGRHDFLEAGGEQFTLVPCLNTSASWVKTVKALCEI